MAIIKGTTENFETEVLKEKKKVLVDFNADWCGPCRMLAPGLEKLSEEKKDVKFVSVNIDEEESLARDYNIFSIPCLIVFKDGKEIGRSVGLKPKEEIEKLIGE